MYGQHCLFFLFLARNIYQLYLFLGSLLCFSTLRSMTSGNIHLPAIFQAYPNYLTAFCPSRWCEARGDPRSIKPPSSIQEPIPCENWRMVGGQLWFLGDDSELKAMPHELPSREFQRDFVPKELRGSRVLQLDTDRHVWTLYYERVLAEKPITLPFYLCGLPVITMLPISPVLTARQKKDPMKKVRFSLDSDLESEHTEAVWKIFPFAAAFCIWMNGHLQLLAPQLSEEDISQLTIPSRVAGLEVSVSRWTPTPTAIGSKPNQNQTPPESSPRVKIGNTESIAGVKVKGISGKFNGQNFLSTSTHAVFEGTTGKRFQTRHVPHKIDMLRDRFSRIFGSKPSDVVLGGIEVCDLQGKVVRGIISYSGFRLQEIGLTNHFILIRLVGR